MKKFLALLLVATLLSGLCTTAVANGNLQTIDAVLNYSIIIRYNGEAQVMRNANGSRVFPITYEGTTYLPVRAISNMLSLPIEWDGENNTVWLGMGSPLAALPVMEEPQLMSRLERVSALLNYGITIRYNGDVQTMYDANGVRVYPITYEGTTYLPVRAVSNMLSVAVEWDGAANTVWLGEKPQSAGAEIPALAGEKFAMRYENAYLGIAFKLPSSWYFYTDEQLLDILGDSYAGTYKDQINNLGHFYDAVISDYFGHNSLNVQILQKTKDQRPLDTNALFNNVYDHLEDVLEEQYENLYVKKTTTTISDNLYHMMYIYGEVSGVALYQRAILVDAGDYYGIIMVTSRVSDSPLRIIENLYELQ